MTVRELLKRIDSKEIAEWQAEFVLRQEDAEREEMRRRAANNATDAMKRRR